MDYAEKMKKWRGFARENKIKALLARPPQLLLWPIGKQQAPIVFFNFWTVTLLLAINAGIIWGTLMFFFSWDDPSPILHLIVASIFFGFFSGIFTAVILKYKKRKLGLTTWEEFPLRARGVNAGN